jgi:hypothetical protein
MRDNEQRFSESYFHESQEMTSSKREGSKSRQRALALIYLRPKLERIS